MKLLLLTFDTTNYLDLFIMTNLYYMEFFKLLSFTMKFVACSYVFLSHCSTFL